MCAATAAAAMAAAVKPMACCRVVIRLLNRRYRGDCVAIQQAHWFMVVLVAHWMMVVSWWSWWQAIWRGWLFHDLVVPIRR